MTTALDSGQRSAVEKLVLRCRALLEEDLAQSLEGRFGIRGDGVARTRRGCGSILRGWRLAGIWCRWYRICGLRVSQPSLQWVV